MEKSFFMEKMKWLHRTLPVPPFHFFDVTDQPLPVPPFHFFDVTDRTLPVPPFHFSEMKWWDWEVAGVAALQ
jgi:hypothetical protein